MMRRASTLLAVTGLAAAAIGAAGCTCHRTQSSAGRTESAVRPEAAAGAEPEPDAAPTQSSAARTGSAVRPEGGAGTGTDSGGDRTESSDNSGTEGPEATESSGTGTSVTESSEAAEAARTEGSGQTRARVIRRSAQCGTTPGDGRVRWLDGEEQYRAALAALDRGRLPGTAPAAAPVDFQTRGVLLVEMGQRATAGYALDLATEEVAVEGGTADVRVRWTEPPEDAMVAQVMTSPCLLVSVRKEGLRAIRVVDQAGRVRETVELPR